MTNLCARFVFFAICLFTHLDISLQTCNGPPPLEYYKETDNADFAIRMKSDGQKIHITISYDTDTNSADNFFKSQLTETLIDGFAQCGVVEFNYNPCTVARYKDQVLFCTSETQCTNDKYHSCIANSLKCPTSMGKFLICVYSGSCMQQCATKYQLNWTDDIEKCVKDGLGGKQCNDFHTMFVDAKSQQAPNTPQAPCAITNFKDTICWVLGQAGLKCDAMCSK
ncbi:uncharacterized protein LOC135844055 [Planococcus citri]|uniref:uncharacterized protein LOC135844055 n=1 Tax=Planococcus citri TaxID=170843 RepID=UPI0031F72807